jgi:hypothetical protein
LRFLTEKERGGKVCRKYKRDHERGDARCFYAPVRHDERVELLKEGLQYVQE